MTLETFDPELGLIGYESAYMCDLGEQYFIDKTDALAELEE